MLGSSPNSDFGPVFCKNCYDLDCFNGSITHRIDVGDAKPVAHPARKTLLRWWEAVDKPIQKLSDTGPIVPCPHAHWVSPPVYANKPDQSLRYCIDLTSLNAHTFDPRMLRYRDYCPLSPCPLGISPSLCFQALPSSQVLYRFD